MWRPCAVLLAFAMLAPGCSAIGMHSVHTEWRPERTGGRFGRWRRHPKQSPVLPGGVTLCEAGPLSSMHTLRTHSGPSDIFDLDALILTPDPPQRNNDLVVEVRGTLHEALRGGTVRYTVAYNGITLVRDEAPLCDLLAREPGLPQCPVAAGAWSVRHAARIPWPVPAGSYTVHAAAWAEDGRPLFCADASVHIVSPALLLDTDRF